MASLTADQSISMLSAPYDAHDPSVPDPVQPRRAYVPGTLAQPGESIFGGHARAQPPGDDLDALFAEDEEIARPPRNTSESYGEHMVIEPEAQYDNDASMAAARRAAREEEDDTNAQSAGLGIDEEVKQRKPRAPIAKLDHDRLCGDKGIPRLRKITKDRLKFKGKGHEFSDIARMLNVYQLWLDDMFPKAKFADGLALIEKLGHTKRMQVMRREWVEEGKPKPRYNDDSHSENEESSDPPGAETRNKEGTQPNDIRTSTEDEDDLYGAPDALFVPERLQIETSAGQADNNTSQNDPEGDELDMLLAEGNAASTTKRLPSPVRQDEDFADEMEAMAGMEWD